MASKGKAVMADGQDSSEKKKRGEKRKNRDVLQFFEDAADEFDASDDGDFSDGFFDDEDLFGDYKEDPKVRNGPEKSDQIPFFPKEEELSGDELEKMLEERYRSGSGFVRYAEDDYDTKRSVDKSFLIPSAVEPIIWKLKCKVGREKKVVFCLIQKYVDLKVLGTKLQIISAFAVEHIKGFVFVEAEKQSDVTEACYQLADVYYTLVVQVPSNEIGQLLNVRRKSNEVKEGTWARVKNGIYRGDLAQVVAVNNERKRATVKLIPRIDMQALMEKYGGGSKLKRPKSAVPIARLISSRDLEELRPLMQYRRDRDTGKVYEFLDGLMLKDGFLFKKLSIDSLAFWDVNPSEDELQKFTPPSHDESDNVEWLSQLYGEKKKKCDVKISKVGGKGGGKGDGKGEGSSGSNEQSGFEVHDLVLFGKKDFGMVIGMEKDEKFKVLKDGSDGPVTVSFEQKELKYLPLEMKFTALDHHMKTISISDTVKVLDGLIKGKQGIVKQIYRGIIFVYDENDLENAYFCTKGKMAEKVKNPDSSGHGKDEVGPSAFEDVPSSPKSPLSPKKPWQMRENSSDDRRDKGAIFSVGQSLRIRVGPLKGYLCRVVAVRYSDVTVKLDSQQRVLTVKSEHLSEVRKSSTQSTSGDPELVSSFKPFDLLGGDSSANDWLQGASGSAEGGGWNVGPSNERSTWSAVSSWGTSAQVDTTSSALPDSVDNDSGKDDTAWLTKINGNQSSCNANAVKKSDDDGAWGKPSGAVASSSWGKAKDSVGDHALSWNAGGSTSGKGSADYVVAEAWESGASNKNHVENTGGWNNPGSSGGAGSSGWGKQKASEISVNVEKSGTSSADAWIQAKLISADPVEDSWGKATSGFKSSVPEVKGWGSSSDPPACDNKSCGKGSGSWTISQEGDTAAGWGNVGGQKCGEDNGQGKMNSWKARSSGDDSASAFNKSGGNDSWGQSKSFDNDQEFNDSRGSGGRRGRGRDQYGRGRGRGRSSDGGHFSSFNKDGPDNHSSGNQGWNKNEGGSSWGNFSAGHGFKSGGGNGKSWNDDAVGDRTVWNHSSELVKDDGGFSSEKNFSGTAWNSAPSGSSSWGQKSEKGKGLATEGVSWGKSSEAKDEASAMVTNDNQTGYASGDPWGKLAESKMSKSSGSNGGWNSTQLGQSAERSATDAWGKGDNSDSSGCGKGGVGWQGKSWDKQTDCARGGNDSWDRSRNSENDQGFGSGRGSSGRGRGRFGRGREYGGGGRGRSDGRGQNSSWRSEGQGGSSWGNSSGRNGGGSSWTGGGEREDKNHTNGGDGGSSGGGGYNNSKSSWGSAGSWSQKGQDNPKNGSLGNRTWGGAGGGNQKGQDEAGSELSGSKSWGSAGGWNQKKQDNEASGNKSWDSGQGGSSCEKSQSGGTSAGGGSSWGKSQPGGSNPGGSSSWGKSHSDEGQNKPAEGGSSWGGGSSALTFLNKTGVWNEKGPDNGDSKPFGNPNQKSGEDKPSWGQPHPGGSSWGNAESSVNSGGGSGWGK